MLAGLDILIPTAIFLERKLSFFESLIDYPREVYGLSFRQIAALLGRDQRNVWTIYSRAAKKRKGLPFQEPYARSNIFFPLSVIKNGLLDKLSPLEAVAQYLSTKGLQNHEIAGFLGRSSKTIWTVIDRARKKAAVARKQGGKFRQRGGLDE